MKKWLALCFYFFSTLIFANSNTLNVYTWAGVIPDAIIQQFEKETGIKVNFSTYDSNETLYAKLRASKEGRYDIIEPSSYYIDRMRKQHMLEELDKTKLIDIANLNPELLNKSYDPLNHYSLPFIWGITGIFVNKPFYSPTTIKTWSALWDKQYANQLMLLNDSREVFAIALKKLGYSTNETNPQHIKQAYQQLKLLMPNIKIFNSDAVISILIDADATLGMAWNGDVFKAQREDKNLTFIYPQDGFVIWVDSFAIPKHAPHPENAYRFLNFIMRTDIAKQIALDNNYPTANLAAQKLLPNAIKNNPTIYPSHALLKKGEYQMDLPDDVLTLYENYWEELKMGGMSS